MIVWFNCKITDSRLNPANIARYNLRDDNRFDIARYSFASFASLEPLVSKFIFNLELADQHQGRESEMEEWLRKIFPADKLVLHWFRRQTASQWKEFQNEISMLEDDLIFPAGNEDHIFLDSSIETFCRGLELVRNDPDPYAVFMTSHWPESIRAAAVFGGSKTDCGTFVHYQMPNNDAIRVIKRRYFDEYVDLIQNSSNTFYRTENWNHIELKNNKIYVPTKEQFRHFDGYAHVQIGPDICPPLEIPTGFFQGMTISYGFADRDVNSVNINPLIEKFYTVDPTVGTDYKYVQSEFPIFWKPFIKEIRVAPNLDATEMNRAYDIHLLDMTRIYINWFHVGQTFNDTNWPPASWINNHTKSYLFTDE